MVGVVQTESNPSKSAETVITEEKGIIDYCLLQHWYFDRFKWAPYCKEKKPFGFFEMHYLPSFHNDEHINATIKAADMLLQKAIFAKKESICNEPPFKIEDDPFNLIGDLEKYNKKNKTTISLDEMVSCIKIAFAGHDLGDIGEMKDGRFEYFENGYHPGKDSEERSAKIFEQRLATLEEQSQNFIIHLIRETTYDPKNPPKPDIPFARFMRFVDFVGNGFFNEDPDRFLGLILEMYNWETTSNRPANGLEKSTFSLNLRHFFNMVPEEFKKYFKDQKDREAILAIWKKKDWQTINDYPKGIPLPKGDTMPELGVEPGLVKVAVWLRDLYGRKK